jgi:hypothetical protein
MKERDGKYRGFSFVTFVSSASAQKLLEERIISLNGVRMEAKPCLPHELERNRDLPGSGGLSSGPTYGISYVPAPPPPQRTWGSGSLNLQSKGEIRLVPDRDIWPAIRTDHADSSANISQVRLYIYIYAYMHMYIWIRMCVVVPRTLARCDYIYACIHM